MLQWLFPTNRNSGVPRRASASQGFENPQVTGSCTLSYELGIPVYRKYIIFEQWNSY
jgi:hypothetical protein